MKGWETDAKTECLIEFDLQSWALFVLVFVVSTRCWSVCTYYVFGHTPSASLLPLWKRTLIFVEAGANHGGSVHRLRLHCVDRGQ